MQISVFKEYDYVTITNKQKKIIELDMPFKAGSFFVENYGTITVKRVKDFSKEAGDLLIDAKKVPQNAVWRLRQNGDIFNKFGGGTKKLKAYLIDKKIPARLRTSIPVLAVGNEVLVIAGVEISESVKLEKDAKIATKISVKLN